MKALATLLFVPVLVLSACKYEAKILNGAELTGEGITFLVPQESNEASSGPGGIKFEGESVKAETDGKILTVNGLNYGKLALGDIVDLRSPGSVTVNGNLRVPVETP